MALFSILPDDLIHSILDDFLGSEWKHLAHLDMAVCNHTHRKQVLQLLSQLDEKALPPYHSLKDVEVLLCWLSQRGITLKQLRLPMDSMDDAWVDDQAPVNVRSISCYDNLLMRSLSHNTDPIAITADMLSAFMRRFPVLRELDCEEWQDVADDVFMGFRDLQCPLEVLKLSLCPEGISAAAVMVLVSSVGSTLQELYCNVLNDQALSDIARLCPNLSSLGVSCEKLEHQRSLAECCAVYGGQLKTLQIYGYPEGSSNDLIASITSSCRNLKHVSLCAAAYSIVCFRHVMDNCPLLESLSICDMYLTVESREDGSRACRIRSGMYLPSQFLVDVCHSLPIPLMDFYVDQSGVNMTDEIVHVMADRFGKDLITLAMFISISFEAMEYLFSRCPNLSTLCVECGAVLENLPQYCPKLNSLTFVYLRNDHAVPFIELLKKFEQKDTLRKLRLSTCSFHDEGQSSWQLPIYCRI